MASIRQVRTGKWEVTVRHASLPKGRKFFTFATEGDARLYGKQWDAMVEAGLAPPQQLLEPAGVDSSLGLVLRARANADDVAASDQATIGLLVREVGHVKFAAMSYAWAESWVRDLKIKANLAPGSVRKRVGTLSRAIDDHLRQNPTATITNPLKLLPKRYSSYSERDAVLVRAVNGAVKTDVERERRLAPGEEERIVAALRGRKREDRERALTPSEDMAMLFVLLICTGLRLKEAYSLHIDQVDLRSKIITARKSKLWHGKTAFKEVPIQPVVFDQLKAYIHSRAGAVLLFPFWDGVEPERKPTNRLSQAFTRAFSYAECADLTEHDLRHEATCRWLELRDRTGGWAFRTEEIHRIMGWAPNSKMAQRYASFRGDSLAARMWA